MAPLLQSWMLLLLFLAHDTLPSVVSEDLCIGIDCDLTDRCIRGKACVKLWNLVELHILQYQNLRYSVKFRVNHYCLLYIIMVQFKAQTTVAFKSTTL